MIKSIAHDISLTIIVNEFGAHVSIYIQMEDHDKLLCVKTVWEICLCNKQHNMSIEEVRCENGNIKINIVAVE